MNDVLKKHFAFYAFVSNKLERDLMSSCVFEDQAPFMSCPRSLQALLPEMYA